MIDVLDALNETIKEKIEEQYSSVKNFAGHIGIPYSTLRDILARGVEETSVTNFVKISRALELNTDSILEHLLESQKFIELEGLNWVTEDEIQKESFLNLIENKKLSKADIQLICESITPFEVIDCDYYSNKTVYISDRYGENLPKRHTGKVIVI